MSASCGEWSVEVEWYVGGSCEVEVVGGCEEDGVWVVGVVSDDEPFDGGFDGCPDYVEIAWFHGHLLSVSNRPWVD